MVEMSQDSVELDLDVEQIKLCLIALDVFNGLISTPVLQAPMIELIKRAEKFYGFKFDVRAALSDLPKFSDNSIGLTSDKLFEKYEELEFTSSLN
jgi:hypothetical protein